METKGVKERREGLHHQEHTKGCTGPDSKAHENEDGIVLLQRENENTLPEHSGELRVGQRQSPQTQIGSCVGDCSEHEFNRVDNLVDEDLSEIEFFFFFVIHVLMGLGKTKQEPCQTK